MWKFVDDSTVSEHLTGNIASAIQPTLNHIESWCSENWMILNPKKCKELRICFLKRSVELQRCAIMAVSRKFQAARKILIFVHIQLLCRALFDIKLKKTTRVINWKELYVWSDLIKVKIFTKIQAATVCEFNKTHSWSSSLALRFVLSDSY